MNAPKPSRAQLHFLLDLVGSGGEGYGTDMVHNPQTIGICRAADWVEYQPVPGKAFEIGKHVITEAGRRAAHDADPAAYWKRLTLAPLPPFTKLQGVGPDQLEAVISAFTEEDWVVIDRDYLEPLGHILMDYLEPLGVSYDVDSVVLFWRLYQRSTALPPEV